MDLYKDMLKNAIEKEKIVITFEQLKLNATEIIENESYKALQKIKTIINDDSFSDKECFIKIEEIIRIFELIGSSGGNRHDFG